jgi:hypothetical protein
MTNKKRGQISIEYLVIVSFITFFIIVILGIALLYSSQIRDSVRMSQIEKFSKKIISSAETVFYAGEPSKSTINAYLPEGVTNIQILEKEITLTISLSSGINRISYLSKVPIDGTISTMDGIKKIQVLATSSKSLITEA